MICQFKMDDRLIHGMVYMTWFPHFKINRAVVVDDEICDNETRKMSLKLGMPASAKLAIWSVEKAAEKFKEGIDQGNNVMVITAGPQAMWGLMEKGIEINEICCGNKADDGKGSVQVSQTMFATADDLVYWKKIVEKGVRVYQQTEPTQNVYELNEKIKNL